MFKLPFLRYLVYSTDGDTSAAADPDYTAHADARADGGANGSTLAYTDALKG